MSDFRINLPHPIAFPQPLTGPHISKSYLNFHPNPLNSPKPTKLSQIHYTAPNFSYIPFLYLPSVMYLRIVL